MDAVFDSNLHGLKLSHRGKARDMYDLGDELLIITTDRLSAFDVVLPDPIPGKGEVLTKITKFWMNKFASIIPNHESKTDLKDVITSNADYERLKTRAVVVKKAKPVLVECVVRGYLIGSGWKDYQKTGEICGVSLPKGLKLAERLPEPIFTPSSKAAVGAHDENISFAKVESLVGTELAQKLKSMSLKLYQEGAGYALKRGLIVADTKFEFGLLGERLILIDEVLTPDSSRFWPASEYRVGTSPSSFDKQFVRDYLESLDWNKKVPGPKLPQDVIDKTAEKYNEALKILTA